MKILLLSLLCIGLISSFSIAKQSPTAQDSGRVEITFNAPFAYLVVDNDFENIRQIKSGEKHTVLAGTRYISLGIPHDAVNRSYVRVLKDSVAQHNIEFTGSSLEPAVFNNNFATATYYDANMMILSELDTEIYYADSLVGVGFAIIDSKLRFPDIQLVDNQGHTFREEPPINGRFTVNEYYLRPDRKKSRSYSIVPGASQFYKKQPIKGLGFSIGTLGFATFSFLKNQEYNSDLIEYNNLLVEYRSATDESQAFTLGNKLEIANDNLQQLDTSRKVFLGLAITTYIGSIVDAFLSTPEGGYSNPKPIQFYFDQNVVGSHQSYSANIRINLGS